MFGDAFKSAWVAAHFLYLITLLNSPIVCLKRTLVNIAVMKRLFITLLVVVIGNLTMLGQNSSVAKIGEEVLPSRLSNNVA